MNYQKFRELLENSFGSWQRRNRRPYNAITRKAIDGQSFTNHKGEVIRSVGIDLLPSNAASQEESDAAD